MNIMLSPYSLTQKQEEDLNNQLNVCGKANLDKQTEIGKLIPLFLKKCPHLESVTIKNCDNTLKNQELLLSRFQSVTGLTQVTTYSQPRKIK